MLDLAGLLGLARRAVGTTPAAVYFHENQITYPSLGRTRAEAAVGMANWGSLLAADGVAFNSAFHREAFFEALPVFLGAYPDRRHGHLIPDVRARCEVVPVGVDLGRIGPLRTRSGPATFLWNHRWDPDKALEDALEAFGSLAADGLDFRLIVAGQPFVDQPEEYREAIEALGDRVVHTGYLDEPAYVEALHSADAVAEHRPSGVLWGLRGGGDVCRGAAGAAASPRLSRTGSRRPRREMPLPDSQAVGRSSRRRRRGPVDRS